ncbi:RNA-directed DNA polymerase, eukaryota [Tanacetum coccineum]
MRNKFFIRGDQEDKKVTFKYWKKCMAIMKAWMARHWEYLRLVAFKVINVADGGINSAATHCSMRTTWGAILHSIFSLKQQDMECSIASIVPLDIIEVMIKETNGYGLLTDEMVFLLLRLKLNRIPSRVNLDRKGIDIGSILCPNCLEDIETVNHIFFNCGMAQDLWALLAKWWELDIPLCANITEWYDA